MTRKLTHLQREQVGRIRAHAGYLYTTHPGNSDHYVFGGGVTYPDRTCLSIEEALKYMRDYPSRSFPDAPMIQALRETERGKSTVFGSADDRALRNQVESIRKNYRYPEEAPYVEEVDDSV